ncbi:MAG: hypothetical protein NC313_05565 [Butyrivibrio sp.]|nr:hypothetical protein [Butyrivibrio sp.]
MYVFPPICNILLKMAGNGEKRYIRIHEDRDDWVYLVIKNLGDNLRYARLDTVVEEDFLRNAFQINERKNRYIGVNISCSRYDKLKVRCLPGDKGKHGKNAPADVYLISPIGYDMFVEILKKIGVETHVITEQTEEFYDKESGKYIIKNKFDSKDFIKMVKDSAEFRFIVNWVFKYQLQEGKERISGHEIEKLYSDMLDAMYKENFLKKSP